MAFGGFYPLKGYKNKILHVGMAVSLINFALVYNLLGIVKAFQNVYDLVKFSHIVIYLLRGLSYTCKIGNLLLFKKNLLLLDDMLQDPITAQVESEEEEILLKVNLKSSKVLKTAYKIYIILSFSIQALYPFINKSSSKTSSTLWLPFNLEHHYFGVYCFEMLEIAVSSCFNAAADMLTVVLMDTSATQFILLEYRLERIKPIFSEEELVEDTLEKIQNYVDQHNQVYRYIFSSVESYCRYNEGNWSKMTYRFSEVL